MTTKTETKEIKAFISLIHYSLILISAIINCMFVALSIISVWPIPFVSGILSTMVVISMSKQFSGMSRRKRIFPLILSEIGRNTYGRLIPTISDNYKSFIDIIIMKKCFLMTGNKEEYKSFKMKISLYRKSLTKKD